MFSGLITVFVSLLSKRSVATRLHASTDWSCQNLIILLIIIISNGLLQCWTIRKITTPIRMWHLPRSMKKCRQIPRPCLRRQSRWPCFSRITLHILGDMLHRVGFHEWGTFILSFLESRKEILKSLQVTSWSACICEIWNTTLIAEPGPLR
ncbi:hypothetical protein EV424DRAFT_326130 [Suillus variegatus]|nr:hypothetical protein EV424DRAFT_326130 [Suillus variegatus]